MAEIGATLREARMRQRLDISDMEMRTKIRAKYLRALENEEWDLLPGPTYVRSFLRTYADVLGLDSKLLVQEYKLRHEQLDASELHPIRRPSGRDRDRRRAGGGPPRTAVVAILLAAIVGALYLIGNDDGDEDGQGAVTTVPAETRERPTTTGRAGGSARSGRPAARRPETVRLQIVPTGEVSVCLVNAAGEVLIGNQILTPGNPTPTFRSRRFRLVLGNANATLVINGTPRTVPPSPTVIGYTITRNGRSDLPESRRPDCT
jgi:hypothetical protein